VADFTDTEYAWAAGFLDGEGCFRQNQAKVVLAFTYEMGLRGCIYTSEQIMKREEIIAAWEAVA
jgi:hypothetical protein